MKKNILVLALAGGLLASCGLGGDSEPTGQVVATVDGQEITVADLNLELGGAKSDDPEEMKQMRDAALRSIVNRHILANAADEQGVADTPTGAMVIKKAEQLAKIELLQQQSVANAKRPSQQDAREFVAQNPGNFANRRIFLVDQLVVPEINSAIVQQMQPLDTLPEIKELLDKNNVTYTNSVGTVDSLAIPAAASQQISNLSNGDVFVVPQGRGVRVNRLRSSEAAPISGEAAEKLAINILGRQTLGKQSQDQLASYITAGQDKVKYNKEYEPEEKPGAAPVTGAPAVNAPATPAVPATGSDN